MTGLGPTRGDGVGIELAHGMLRAVRFAATEPGTVVSGTVVSGTVVSVAEVAVADRHDDCAVVDSFVRLRAELGDPGVPTRVALFPPGSVLRRVDATGANASDLNALRTELVASNNASSSVLVDDGPRRWLVGVAWDDVEIRRVEELAEHAGFIDVAIDPSPVALARVLGESITQVRRDAATDESFAAVVSHGMVLAAAALDSIGRMSPGLTCSDATVSTGWFDERREPTALVAEIERLLETARPVDCHLELAGTPYPPCPPHDLRAPQRQCVALGAALGAAGLAGRLRPVDMHAPAVAGSSRVERPWVGERVSNLPARRPCATIGPLKRFVARLLPRRH